MGVRFKEHSGLHLPKVQAEIQESWAQEQTFQKSLNKTRGDFTFFEGPPSANGMPGIHHVMARAIKDAVCRYKTMQGFRVLRKAGWDTHGLPVELQVEKELNLTKEDIGKTISIEDYNAACRKAVMRFTGEWQKLTDAMGYWVDMQDPYITYDPKYMESVWWILQQFYKKGLLYKGYTIQPYSPAAGTGLSSHELNQPGAYRNVKDTTLVAQFKLMPGQSIDGMETGESDFCLAWTTTPWTLPSNTALAVGPNIQYVLVETQNPYTREAIRVWLAEERLANYFAAEMENQEPAVDQKKPAWKRIGQAKGSALAGLRYEPLFNYARPEQGDAYRVIPGDFVTTADGTGMVHIAPSFGSDDFKVAAQHGIGSLTLVDEQGRFTPEVTDFAGEYVKESYVPTDLKKDGYESVDVRIAVLLKQRNRAFKIEKYEHSYPHCWRTDKPILYFPLDSWFVRTTALKSRLLDLNKSIRWKPESTGTGRFGNWLENLIDWNLSRSRFWGIPLPIWRSDDGSEEICIGSVEELSQEIERSMQAGWMTENPYALHNGKVDYSKIDLHRPVVDQIVLVSPSGKPMRRESDLIDVWFDSGSMPFAQWHYPFENKEKIDSGQAFPADFIAEGVDQTRGWFFTLHVIAAGIMDSVAYKTVISNGLVQDKNGMKMSKRLGNAVDPFQAIEQHGADALRWYMLTNASPWDDLKFNPASLDEGARRFFSTLHNTYSFLALYSNVDGLSPRLPHLPEQPSEFDRWMLSRLGSLHRDVTAAYEDFDLTQAGRLLQAFTDTDLSNWYVRLSRRRFWKEADDQDKQSAFYTLHYTLCYVSLMMAPVAPFYSDRLYRDLTGSSSSVHLANWPQELSRFLNPDLEYAMELAQTTCSLILSIRKSEKIRVRQPLQRVLIPVLDQRQSAALDRVSDIIKAEVNVKSLELHSQPGDWMVLKAKADFKKLGPRFGKDMKEVALAVENLSQADIQKLNSSGRCNLTVSDGRTIELLREDLEIRSQDVPGWQVATNGPLTVALDLQLSPELLAEGTARDLVNRIQNLRKDSGLDVGDRIRLAIYGSEHVQHAVQANNHYICTEVLALTLTTGPENEAVSATEVELEGDLRAFIYLEKTV
ncbi:MAG: isoleucine--tRNA ligase [Bacteroidetes bacterium]|nr:isoleucine--tRNA ligase [Bacteroidota bacterium]